MAKITLPILTKGGSCPDTLLHDLTEALNAVYTAEKLVGQTAPHARDYAADRNAYTAARNEHSARMHKLEVIKTELQQLAFGIAGR